MSEPSDSPARRGYHHGNLRETLLEAARDLVAERGPQGFTLIEAARRAGVSPSAPYRHFKDREEVLAALAARGFLLFGESLRAAAAAASSPREALRAMGPAYLGFARREPGYYAAMFSFQPAEVPAGDAHPRFAAFEALVQAVSGSMPPGGPDPRMVALQVWALSHGVAMLERAGMPPPELGGPPPEEILRHGVEALLRPR
jgi:AcrR family transcriptional regulator